jgi:hypothetical protein
VTYTKIAAESEGSQFTTLNDKEFNELLENVESHIIIILFLITAV